MTHRLIFEVHMAYCSIASSKAHTMGIVFYDSLDKQWQNRLLSGLLVVLELTSQTGNVVNKVLLGIYLHS